MKHVIGALQTSDRVRLPQVALDHGHRWCRPLRARIVPRARVDESRNVVAPAHQTPDQPRPDEAASSRHIGSRCPHLTSVPPAVSYSIVHVLCLHSFLKTPELIPQLAPEPFHAVRPTVVRISRARRSGGATAAAMKSGRKRSGNGPRDPGH